MLLMQDFPLLWGYARSRALPGGRPSARRGRPLGHHPSIASWTAHNDPAAVDATSARRQARRSRPRYIAAHQLPSWNKTILDR